MTQSNQPHFLSVPEAQSRLAEAGHNVTKSSIRRWCEQGLGGRLKGRWRIPEWRIADMIRQSWGEE